jgi:hypothetical protein
MHKISGIKAAEIKKSKIMGYKMNFAKKLYLFCNFIFGQNINFMTVPLIKISRTKRELNLKKADTWTILS